MKRCWRDCAPAVIRSPWRKNDSRSRIFPRSRIPDRRNGATTVPGRSIRLEVDAKSVIQSVTITTLGTQEGKCSDRRPDFLDPKNWLTGLGLRMGDSQDRVVGLYGEPNSSGPASKNGQELALMYYQFDWAGSDVPQVMEVLCARDTGRVVEITLAFPSL